MKFTTAFRTRTAASGSAHYQQTKNGHAALGAALFTDGKQPSDGHELREKLPIGASQRRKTASLPEYLITQMRIERTCVLLLLFVCFPPQSEHLFFRRGKTPADRRCLSHSLNNQQSRAYILLNFGLDFPPARCQINIFARRLPASSLRTHTLARHSWPMTQIFCSCGDPQI